MKLLRLEIQNFGALRDFRLDLSDGLNTLCRENGCLKMCCWLLKGCGQR